MSIIQVREREGKKAVHVSKHDNPMVLGKEMEHGHYFYKNLKYCMQREYNIIIKLKDVDRLH